MKREGRALLYALKRICKGRRAVGKRLLFLVDNMAVCLCFSRYRAKSFGLLAIIRKFAALSLAKHIYPAIRWIPSERNTSDAPSRYSDYLYRLEKQYSKKSPCEQLKTSKCEEDKQHKSKIVKYVDPPY